MVPTQGTRLLRMHACVKLSTINDFSLASMYRRASCHTQPFCNRLKVATLSSTVKIPEDLL